MIGIRFLLVQEIPIGKNNDKIGNADASYKLPPKFDELIHVRYECIS